VFLTLVIVFEWEIWMLLIRVLYLLWPVFLRMFSYITLVVAVMY
jgi:hypothetical protein